MNNPIFFLLLLLLGSQVGYTQQQNKSVFTPPTTFQKTEGKATGTYEEVIEWWKQVANRFPEVSIHEEGLTDDGTPLHVVVVSKNRKAGLSYQKKETASSNRLRILINNGIHPGEPDGIDASMLLVQEVLEGKFELPSNIDLYIIPLYNIGGAKNRSPFYRANQNGPDSPAFRGNAQNLDLNRDFIKLDSRNAQSFVQLFQKIDPDIFIDNHVSNGADYQHVMTLISTQHNKLGNIMGPYLEQQMEPAIYAMMRDYGYDLIPYVNFFGSKPEAGWRQFFEGPRYSSGYAALFQTFSFMPETHMLKPYPQRVDATKKLMMSFMRYGSAHASSIKKIREEQRKEFRNAEKVALSWTVNDSQFKQITFKGFQSGQKLSTISGLNRLYYDRDKPFTALVPFYNQFQPSLFRQKPIAYLLPAGWWKIADRLRWNGIEMRKLEKDSLLTGEYHQIVQYKASARPFEGHFLHSEVKTETIQSKLLARKGDWLISVNQKNERFLLEVLEPDAPDSYFAWNFFDAILGQKEGYSDYVFEETLSSWLNTQPELRKELEKRRKTDTNFAKNHAAQLNFLYRKSPWYESAHMRYPVFRVLK
jgi:hypothetical protein